MKQSKQENVMRLRIIRAGCWTTSRLVAVGYSFLRLETHGLCFDPAFLHSLVLAAGHHFLWDSIEGIKVPVGSTETFCTYSLPHKENKSRISCSLQETLQTLEIFNAVTNNAAGMNVLHPSLSTHLLNVQGKRRHAKGLCMMLRWLYGKGERITQAAIMCRWCWGCPKSRSWCKKSWRKKSLESAIETSKKFLMQEHPMLISP